SRGGVWSGWGGPPSPAPKSRENPATSAAKIAASFRSMDGASNFGTSPTRSIYRPRVRSEGFSAILRPAGAPSRVRTRFRSFQRDFACTGAAKDLRRKRSTSLNSPIGTIQNSGMRPLKAGLIYFLLVFALGWVLGPIRELWAVPRFGRITSLLIEAIIMLIAMVISSRWVMRRFNVPQSLGSTIPMGLVA